MDTLIRIYLYFIGVIAVLICFITWVSIRLRAERINRIRIEKERDIRYNALNNLLNETIKTSHDSSIVYNDLIEFWKKNHNEKSQLLSESELKLADSQLKIMDLDKMVSSLSSDNDKLTDYANTLFKDLKGALEMNAKLMEATIGVEQAGDESMDNWRSPILQ